MKTKFIASLIAVSSINAFAAPAGKGGRGTEGKAGVEKNEYTKEGDVKSEQEKRLEAERKSLEAQGQKSQAESNGAIAKATSTLKEWNFDSSVEKQAIERIQANDRPFEKDLTAILKKWSGIENGLSAKSIIEAEILIAAEIAKDPKFKDKISISQTLKDPAKKETAARVLDLFKDIIPAKLVGKSKDVDPTVTEGLKKLAAEFVKLQTDGKNGGQTILDNLLKATENTQKINDLEGVTPEQKAMSFLEKLLLCLENTLCKV